MPKMRGCRHHDSGDWRKKMATLSLVKKKEKFALITIYEELDDREAGQMDLGQD